MRRGITDLVEPSITLHKYGSGYGIAYAFFPGFHYQQSANWDDNIYEPSQQTTLPYGWGKLQCDIIIAPAKIANGTQGTPKPIAITYVTRDGKTQDTMVEACLLESEKGIAIVLLNWSGTPGQINNLTMTINNSITNIPVGSRISSAQGNAVTPHTTSRQPPFDIILSVLEYVDVVMVEYPPSSTNDLRTTVKHKKKEKYFS